MNLFDEISPLVRQIADLQASMRELGMFDHSRQILECSRCGLAENVTFEGYLLTERPDTPDVDTGLRFVELEETGKYRCPACGETVEGDYGVED